jgi:precorrin-6B methylase 2
LLRRQTFFDLGIMELAVNDQFTDIGTGSGTIPCYVAMTTGCTARGIELVPERHALSLAIKDGLSKMLVSAG